MIKVAHPEGNVRNIIRYASLQLNPPNTSYLFLIFGTLWSYHGTVTKYSMCHMWECDRIVRLRNGSVLTAHRD